MGVLNSFKEWFRVAAQQAFLLWVFIDQGYGNEMGELIRMVEKVLHIDDFTVQGYVCKCVTIVWC